MFKALAAELEAVGGWAAIPDPFALEVYAAQGWDSVTLDMQHGASNINDAVHPVVMQGKTISCTFSDGERSFTLSDSNSYFNDNIKSSGKL